MLVDLNVLANKKGKGACEVRVELDRTANVNNVIYYLCRTRACSQHQQANQRESVRGANHREGVFASLLKKKQM
jgi:hypothetical protein